MPEDEDVTQPSAGPLTTEVTTEEVDWSPQMMTPAEREGPTPIPGSEGGQGSTSLTTVAGFRPSQQTRRGGRRAQAPVTYQLQQTVDLSPGDPALDAAARDASMAVAESERDIYSMGADAAAQSANLRIRNANILNQQIAREEEIVASQEREADDMLNQVTDLNEAVMNQTINPARFFTDNRGAGLASAASVALGVLGQGLNPNIGNAAMTIIDRAVERDINAQVAGLQNRRAGVAMARNLYGDLLRTYQNEAVARSTLRSMYYTEMERRVAALRDQTQSREMRARGDQIILNLQEQQAQAAAEAARARSRIVYQEVTQGSQRVGSQRGIRAAASQMRASSPLMATGVAQALAQHGIDVNNVPGLPTAREQLQSSDVRGASSQARVADSNANRRLRRANQSRENAAERTVEAQESEINTRGDTPFDRRQSRRFYRNQSTQQFRVVPNLEQIRTPQGMALGIRTGVSRAASSGNPSTDVDIFRPVLSNGRMIAVSTNGSRYVRPGETLRSNERLAGATWVQEHRSVSAESARYVRQTSNALPVATVGNEQWVLPPEAVQQLDRQTIDREIEQIEVASRGRRLVNRTLRRIRDLENSGIAWNPASDQGAVGPDLLQIQGLMAQISGLGVLQEGEREAIRDMTSLPTASEDWTLFWSEQDRTEAALLTIRRGMNDILGSRRLSSMIRRVPTGRDVASRFTR